MKKSISAISIILMLSLLLSSCTINLTPPVAESSAPEIESSEEPSEQESSEESSEEVESSQEKPSPKKTSGNQTLSDDIYSFQLKIDGDVYSFPMTYDDFIGYGWKSKEDDSESIPAGRVSSIWVMEKGKSQCYIDVGNFNIDAAPLNKGYVVGVSMDKFMIKDDNLEVMLSGGFVINEAEVGEVTKKFGTPSYESEDGRSIEYKIDYNVQVGLRFDEDTKKLYSIDLENYVEPDDFEVGEISTDIPDIVKKYSAPTSMSNKYSDFMVTLDKKVYQLPAPVSEFLADGWTILEKDTNMEIPGTNFGWVTLMKNNQKLRSIAQNYSENATTIENCFVTTVKSSTMESELDLVIGNNISIGTPKADLEKAISGEDFEKDEESSSYIYYEFAPGSSSLDEYTIYVNKETDKVYKIEVEHGPKYSEYTKK